MTFSDMLFSNKNDEQNTNSNVIQLQHSLLVILVLLCILSLDLMVCLAGVSNAYTYILNAWYISW